MKRKHKSKVERYAPWRNRMELWKNIKPLDMREECENKRHLHFLILNKRPKACMSEIPKSRWWRGLDMHGREMGRRRPRNLKSTFCKNIKKKILDFFSCLKWNGSQKIKINWMRLKVSSSASPCYVIVYIAFSWRSALWNCGIENHRKVQTTPQNAIKRITMVVLLNYFWKN